MRAILILAACTMLSGCLKSGTLKGSGEVAPPPVGWDTHCKTIPKPDECGK